MQLTTISQSGINLSQFSDKEEIAQLQADTLRHALSVSAQLQAEINPEWQETKRIKIKSQVEIDKSNNFKEIILSILVVVCVLSLIKYAPVPVHVPAQRTVADGDAEATNKILQRDLMLAKSALDSKTREVEMLEREFKAVNAKLTQGAE